MSEKELATILENFFNSVKEDERFLKLETIRTIEQFNFLIENYIDRINDLEFEIDDLKLEINDLEFEIDDLTTELKKHKKREKFYVDLHDDYDIISKAYGDLMKFYMKQLRLLNLYRKVLKLQKDIATNPAMSDFDFDVIDIRLKEEIEARTLIKELENGKN